MVAEALAVWRPAAGERLRQREAGIGTGAAPGHDEAPTI
jgi:hypothetical protein